MFIKENFINPNAYRHRHMIWHHIDDGDDDKCNCCDDDKCCDDNRCNCCK
ncbi:hypothetical protein [Clostridium estertheticum]|nr:hypothetical protein [Clostridium estertheticum]MCB2361712.1 hypothetical protein [Clostridium estertheticum]